MENEALLNMRPNAISYLKEMNATSPYSIAIIRPRYLFLFFLFFLRQARGYIKPSRIVRLAARYLVNGHRMVKATTAQKMRLLGDGQPGILIGSYSNNPQCESVCTVTSQSL